MERKDESMKRRLLSILMALALVLGLAAPVGAAETAAVIRLTKTTGTVKISKSSGKTLSQMTNMRLYNGYHVTTAKGSYAWLNLDDAKLLKEDAASEVEVRQSGKKLEVKVWSGSVFFNVTEKLADDESLNISTSTMIVGIRGTSGYVQVVDRWTTLLTVLEGTVECSVSDPVTGQIKTEEIHGGETVKCVVYPQEQPGDKCDILRDKLTTGGIPGFVLTELVQDIPLCDKIQEATGVDIPRDLATVAGGDPSGRQPDGETATPEVLGEAERQEELDESTLQKKLDEVAASQGGQEGNVSGDKALPKQPSTGGGGGGYTGGGGGGSDPTPAPSTKPENMMPLTIAEVQALLDGADNVTIQASGTPADNTLTVDADLTVPAGKTLTLDPGIGVTVEAGKTLQVNGTMVVSDNITNNGTVTVTSSNTLRVGGDFTNKSTLTVTDTGKVVVDGALSWGTLTLTRGATVMAKTKGSGTPPIGWSWSAAADSSGYYTLIYTAPTYAVTFDANGGRFPPAESGSDVEQTLVQTGEDGKIPAGSWPADPTQGSFIFEGWFTEATGGTEVNSDNVFTAPTTLYAHWAWWSYDEVSKTLTILDSTPDYGNGGNARPWADKAAEIKTVVIADGVKKIGGSAFYGCTSLQNVTIPDSVTSIGNNAFDGCTSLTRITIPDSVTSFASTVFHECTSLEEVTLPSGLTSIPDYTFDGCRNLTSVTIPENVTTIDTYAFRNCASLTKVTIPEGVTNIGGAAFFKCTNLAEVNIPPNVKGIWWHTFNGCSSLTSITIPKGVATIGNNAFQGCTSLQSVTIPNSVTTMEKSAFQDCTRLTAVTIPGSVNSIGDYAFHGCTRLDSVTISNGVKSIASNAFSSCSALTNVVIPDSVTSIGVYAFEGCTSLISVTIPDSVTVISARVFYKCSSLTSVTIPNTVTSIDAYAFAECRLTNVTIPDSVKSIGQRAFYKCTALTTITLPATVTEIVSDAFEACDDISITFKGTQTQWEAFGVTLPTGATVNCTDGTIPGTP